MTSETCGACGASVDVYMTECSQCRTPIAAAAAPGALANPWAPATGPWSSPATFDAATIAVMPTDQTRSGDPVSTTLAWVIAALPVVLLVTSLAASWWPHVLVLVPHALIVLAVVGWDSRRLDRELVDVSWVWVFLTPATYLFVRAARTGRGLAAAWVGLATTTLWIIALLVGIVVVVFQSAQVTNLRLAPEMQELAAATRNYQEATTLWMSTPGNSETPTVQAAARRLSTALDELRLALEEHDFSDDVSAEVDAFAATLGRLADDVDDVAAAERTLDISRESCEASITAYDNDVALVAYLSAIGDEEAEQTRAALPLSQAGADYCAFRLPFLDAIQTFSTNVRRHQTAAAVQQDYETFADDLIALGEELEQRDWPEEVESEVDAVITAYDKVADAALQVSDSLASGDYRTARADAQAMVRGMREAATVEREFFAALTETADALLD